MQIWNVLHATRWKCRTQKIAKNLPSVQHRTTLSGYIFATKAHIDNRKKTSSTCPPNMANVGPLTAEIRFTNLGHPSTFQWVVHLGSIAARHSFDTHEWIWIFLGVNVTHEVSNQKTLYYATSNNLCFCTTCQNEETWKWHFRSIGLCYTNIAPVRYLPERKNCHLWCVW